MVAIKDLERKYYQDRNNLDKKRELNRDIIKEATDILRIQAAQIVFDIKANRDKRYCLAKICCKEENRQLSFSELIAHHIEDIDHYIADFHSEFFKENDLFSEIDYQKFLEEVEDYGVKELNTYYNLITVCHECSVRIHKNVNFHIIRLRRIARKQTDSWDNQKRILDYFPEHKKISTELSEVKETLNRLSIDLVAKEKIKESNEKIVQNLTANLDTLRRTVENYENRLAETSSEVNMFKNQLITSIKSTMLKTEFENKKEEEVGFDDLEQEQGEVNQESIIPNDQKTSEKINSVKKAHRLHEMLNEELSPIAKKRIRKLIPILDKLESKRKTEFYYVDYDRGYKIYNKDKIEFLRILLYSPIANYTKDIGLTLFYEEGTPEYGRRVGKTKRYGLMKDFENLERSIEIAYDAAVQDNNINYEIVIIQ